LFNILVSSFLEVEAKSNATQQPEVCSWPSEMMSQYFNFQNEARSIILWSDINERRFYASSWKWWLFTKWTLKLPSALDFVASNVWWNTKRGFSTTVTSVVLLLMVSKSVFQSNTEWLAILFKDRPIVRDYRQMLDIETQLFDMAYFLWREVKLTLPLDWDVFDRLNNLIKKYQKSGLFEERKITLNNKWSMADILEELVSINTSMKHFILFLGKPWTKPLEKYNWCFWEQMPGNCNENNAVLRFSEKAIKQLKEDYSGLWNFGACNLYASNFKSSISKWWNNNMTSVRAAFDDVEDAIDRLLSLFVGNSSKWTNKWNKKWRCNLSDYEMAQLRAYWWPSRTCRDWLVDAQVYFSKAVEFSSNKKAQREQSKKSVDLLRYSLDTASNSIELVSSRLKSLSSTRERGNEWFKSCGENCSSYNPEFRFDMNDKFKAINDELLEEFELSQNEAQFSDVTYELNKIRWLLVMVKACMDSAEILKNSLKAISDYQCSS
jgi:hypothetical protein